MIKVSNLTKIFKRPIRKPGLKGMITTLFSHKYDNIVAVDDISFEIAKGEIVGYIGSNGAGKSTTIKMMSGILTPTKGQVFIDGIEPYNSKTRQKILKRIGVVFGQRSQLWWDLPIIETYNILKLIYEIPEAEFNERFNYLVNLLDVKSFLNSPARTLSLGQRMKADLIGSLLHNPEILFLDKPTIGLDVLAKEKILQAIKDINQKYQTTIILTTHDMNDIAELCKRIIIIDDGHLIFDDDINKLKNRFGNIRYILINSKERIDLEEFNARFDNKLSFSIKEGLLVTFDANLIDLNAVVEYIFNHCKVTDFKINENNIEDVVKKIYEDKEVK